MALAETHNVWPGGEPVELCDRRGAEALKETIEAYWRERGHEVECFLERQLFSATMRGTRYDLRSNLIDGLPPLLARSAANA